MWVIVEKGCEPIIISNDADASIGEFVSEAHPKASVYVCRERGAFARYASHVNAQKVVVTEQPGTDEDGKPIRVTVSDWQPVGNTATVTGEAMRLLNAAGQEIGKLILEPVA